MDRLILDTGLLVAAVRGKAAVPDDADIAIPAIVIAEYLAGIERSSPDRQAAQRAFLTDVLDAIPIIDYDRTAAEHHAVLLAHTARQGQRRGPHDLIIAD